MTERNRDLFYKIADAIEQNSKHWSQKAFVDYDEVDDDDIIVLDHVVVGDDEVSCGTSHCVAGWAVAIAKPELLRVPTHHRQWTSFSEEARDLLGLSKEEADVLFFKPEWIDGGGDLDIDAWQNHPKQITASAAAQRLREIGDGAPVRGGPMDKDTAIAVLCDAANSYRWKLWAEDGYVEQNQRESRGIAKATRSLGGLATTIGEGWD